MSNLRFLLIHLHSSFWITGHVHCPLFRRTLFPKRIVFPLENCVSVVTQASHSLFQGLLDVLMVLMMGIHSSTGFCMHSNCSTIPLAEQCEVARSLPWASRKHWGKQEILAKPNVIYQAGYAQHSDKWEELWACQLGKGVCILIDNQHSLGALPSARPWPYGSRKLHGFWGSIHDWGFLERRNRGSWVSSLKIVFVRRKSCKSFTDDAKMRKLLTLNWKSFHRSVNWWLLQLTDRSTWMLLLSVIKLYQIGGINIWVVSSSDSKQHRLQEGRSHLSTVINLTHCFHFLITSIICLLWLQEHFSIPFVLMFLLHFVLTKNQAIVYFSLKILLFIAM